MRTATPKPERVVHRVNHGHDTAAALIRTAGVSERDVRAFRRELQDLAGELGMPLEVFEDPNHDREHRPTWRQLRERLLADTPTFRTLLLAELGQLGASAGDVAIRLDELLRAGVRVIVYAANKRHDVWLPGSVDARKWHRAAKIERDHRSRRAKDSIEVAHADGRKTGRPGWEWTEDAYAALDALRADGKSLRDIADNELLEITMSNGTLGTPSYSAMRRALDARGDATEPDPAPAAGE